MRVLARRRNAVRWYIPLRQVMHRRRADRSFVSGVGFWWYVGGGEPNRRVALTDCKGDDAIGFVVRYFDG